MKAHLFTSKGEKKSEIELPKVFNTPVREDMAVKLFEVTKEYAPYAPGREAGKRHSASGKISHRRHKWQTAYGKGISRVPRKRMWRRGTQFFWIGAEVSSTRGGRRAHPPKVIFTPKKINRNEVKMAMDSALASTANVGYILKRYSTLKDIKSAPFVIESVPTKTKDVLDALKKIFGELFYLVLKNKVVRSGKGKTRGRKYRKKSGPLIIVSSTCSLSKAAKNIPGIDIAVIDSLNPELLAPGTFPGRLTIFSQDAVTKLEKQKLFTNNQIKEDKK